MATDEGMVESDEYKDWIDRYGEEPKRSTQSVKRIIRPKVVLKPCPFCGKKPLGVLKTKNGERVYCDNEAGECPIAARSMTPSGWNRRVT